MGDEQAARDFRLAALKIAGALVTALAFCFGVYALLEATRPLNGLISFSFLLLLPAAVSAFVAYVADPWSERSYKSYLMVPVWLLVAAIAASVVVLREGTICIVMLSPLWLASGAAGATATYRIRRRLTDGRAYCATLLALPLIAMQVEPLVPLPTETRTVSRSVVVSAAPGRIWPFLRGIPDVHPDEGRWNLSQDLVGLPRPRGARLVGDSLGAERLARWERGIGFRERITEWAVDRRIGWRFEFGDTDGWAFTDRHLTPDSAYFRVVSGGYRLEPLGPRRTRVTLHTAYWMQTPVNAYSALWGELFLGDIENNLLAVVKRRAEAPADRENG